MSTGVHAPASSWGVFETWADDDRLAQVDIAPVSPDGLTDHRVGVLKTLDGRRCWCCQIVEERGKAVGVLHRDATPETPPEPEGAGC